MEITNSQNPDIGIIKTPIIKLCFFMFKKIEERLESVCFVQETIKSIY